jgi:2-iminobutanoate/2-iminopropanoate deaminase
VPRTCPRPSVPIRRACSSSASCSCRGGATDPATGKLVSDDVAEQTAQCLKNVETILQAAGSNLHCVLRCGVFLLDMQEFPKMNEVYARTFGEHRPARTTIQAAGLPGVGLRVEIDAIAYIP